MKRHSKREEGQEKWFVITWFALKSRESLRAHTTEVVYVIDTWSPVLAGRTGTVVDIYRKQNKRLLGLCWFMVLIL